MADSDDETRAVVTDIVDSIIGTVVSGCSNQDPITIADITSPLSSNTSTTTSSVSNVVRVVNSPANRTPFRTTVRPEPGMENCNIQASSEEDLKNLLKGAILSGDIEVPDLVAISVYNTKHVNFLSMCRETAQWVKKTRKIYDHSLNKVVESTFLRLNINDL